MTSPETAAARSLAAVTDVVIALADRAIQGLTDPARAGLERIRDALREPVRIAVAGRVNAGKSTLVNALVGQVVAPTDVSECTRMVTWYRYGSPQRLEIVLHDGTRRRERLGPGGQLPPEIGVHHSEVRCLEVWLANESLRSMTLIDTPGLSSLNADYSAAAQDLLAADQVADAIVFTLNNVVREDEAAALRSFRESSGPGGMAGNAIGVLSKADKLASGPGWWDTSTRLAKRVAEQLADDVVTVLPVAGLIAQSAEGAVLTEGDAAALAALAELDVDRLDLLLLAASRFTGSADSPLNPEQRHRLLGLLDLQGIAAAVELIRDGDGGAAALRRGLAKLSGIEALRYSIAEAFRGKGEALKIRSAFQAIDRLCGGPAAGVNAAALRALAEEAERFRLSPLCHQLAEAQVLALCDAGAVELPAELIGDVRRIASGRTLAERLGVSSGDVLAARQAALEGNTRWRRQAVGAAPAVDWVARVLQRSYALAFEQAGGA
jgi:50S ribosome-binding GTPase